MKMRGIIIIDYEIPSGSMQEVALEAQRLKEATEAIQRASINALRATSDIKERRGDGFPDLQKVKFRTS